MTPTAAQPARTEVLAQDRRSRLLITLCWVAVVLPQVIQSLTAPQHRGSIEVDETSLSPMASLSRTVLTLALGGVALWLILSSVRRAGRHRLMPLVVVLMPWCYLVVRDWYVSGRPSMAALLVPVVAFALWMLQPSLRCLSTLGYLTIVAALLSVAMAVIEPSSAIYRTSVGDVIFADKELLPWGLLTGFLTQPNVLGMFLALGLPAVFLIPRNSIRRAGVVLCGFAIVWTASRTSLYAAAAGCLVAIVLAAVRSPSLGRWVGSGAIVLTMGTVCVLPFLPTEPTAFTNRSFIWQASLPYWHLDPWFGQGADWYAKIAKTSAAIAGAAFHGHNQLVQLLVTGGLCYAIVVGILLSAVTVCAVRQMNSVSIFGVVYLVVLAGQFTLEVSFPTVDNTLMLPLVLVPLSALLFSRDNARPSNSALLPEGRSAQPIEIGPGSVPRSVCYGRKSGMIRPVDEGVWT